jgi:electron transfer flavoprotein-quinone oxidoreductase
LPAIAERRSIVLTPEGALSAGYRSERLGDLAHRTVIVGQRDLSALLLEGAIAHGARVLESDVMAVTFQRGFASGGRAVAGEQINARCTLFADGPRHPAAVSAGLVKPLLVTESAVTSEWRLRLPADTLAERFGLEVGTACEWWLAGEPFRGVPGMARLRALATSVLLGVAAPLSEVRTGSLVTANVAQRLLGHPSVVPLLMGATVERVEGALRPTAVRSAGVAVGDGFVHLSNAPAGALFPASLEVALGRLAAEAVDEALTAPRPSAARLAPLRRAVRPLLNGAVTLPFSPIQAWGDALLTRPERLWEFVRDMAEVVGEAD